MIIDMPPFLPTALRCLRLMTIGLGFASAGFATAAAQSAPINVVGEWVTLGDILGDVGGASSVRITRAPAPGQSLALDPVMVIRAAESAGLIVENAPADALTVRRTSAAVTANGFTVGVPNGSGEPTLAGIEPLAEVPSARPARPSATLSSAASSSPATSPDPDVVYVLTLSRDIKRGELLVEADLEWTEARGNRAPFGAASSMDELIGQESKRDLRAGLALRKSDVKTPSVVKKGERVLLIFEAEGLRVTTEGRALADAAMGDTVRVMNLYSNRSIDAVATGPGKAHVSPPGQISGV